MTLEVMMSRVLYIRHLPSVVTERKLERLFSRFGAVLNAEVISNADSNRLGHFGVVTMDTEEGARAAVTALHRSVFFDGALSVRCATSKFDRNVAPDGSRR
jgi:RNA recognition motif-containing protein